MDQIEEIKQKTNIVNLVGGYVTLKKSGRNHKGLCPFHGEKSPSFMVNEELGIYKCFGCGVGGDVIKFLEEIEGLEFYEALEKLASRAGVKLVEKQGRERNIKRDLLKVHDLATEYYHYLLIKHEAGRVALSYLVERGINEKLIETFRLGYSLPEWDGLTKYLIGKKGYRDELLVDAGLASRSGNRVYDRFRGRVMLPLSDTAGRIVGFTGRVLPVASQAMQAVRPGTDEAKYLNSPETEIYHKGKVLYGLGEARPAIRKNDRVILVEGQMDMISSFGAGVTETVAVGGTALTGEMIETLGRLTTNLVLALDNDFAGEAAMKRSIEAAEKRGMSIKMVEMVGEKDPDEIARKDPKRWREMVANAVPVYQFFFDKAVNRFGTETAEAIGHIVDNVIPYLAKIENSVVREVWVKKIAERLGVDKARVWEELEKERSGRRSNEATKKIKEDKTRKSQDGLTVIAVLMTLSEKMIGKIKRMLIGLPLFGSEGKLVELILTVGGTNKPADFIASLPEELAETAKEAYLLQPEAQLGEKEVVKLIIDWAKRTIKSERENLMIQMRKAQEQHDAAALDNLGAKMVKLNVLENKMVVE